MLESVLRHLGEHGVDEAILSLGYLPDQFLASYPDGHCGGVALRYAVEPERLDTAGAIRFAAQELGTDETFIVVNGDVLTDLDVSKLVAFHKSHGAEGTVALHPVDDPSRYGVVPTHDDGRVIAFVEKPPKESAPTNLINAGTYVFEPSFLRRIPLGERVSVERVTFPAMVEDGTLFAMEDDSYWLDTGTPEAYLQAHHDILKGRRPFFSKTGTLVDGSFIHDDATVSSSAQLSDTMIDARVHVEEGAVVRDSVLLPGAIVERDAIVEGSILGGGSRIGSGAVIHPTSVIGFGVQVAPNSELADARVSD
jgi:mannose-1-phosphate guanylyltransferase